MGQYRADNITPAYSAADKTNSYWCICAIMLYSNIDSMYFYEIVDMPPTALFSNAEAVIERYQIYDILIEYSIANNAYAYKITDNLMLYMNTDVSYLCCSVDASIIYEAEELFLPIWVHTHGYFTVPSEQIDGERYEFTFPGQYTEILLNGIPQLYTKTATGISLDEAPVVGDHLWGWWTL